MGLGESAYRLRTLTDRWWQGGLSPGMQGRGQRYGLGAIAEVACTLDYRTEADLSFLIRTSSPHHRRQNVKVDLQKLQRFKGDCQRGMAQKNATPRGVPQRDSPRPPFAPANNSPIGHKPRAPQPRRSASERPRTALQKANLSAMQRRESNTPAQPQFQPQPQSRLGRGSIDKPPRAVLPAPFARRSRASFGSPSRQSLHRDQSLRAIEPTPQILPPAMPMSGSEKPPASRWFGRP